MLKRLLVILLVVGLIGCQNKQQYSDEDYLALLERYQKLEERYEATRKAKDELSVEYNKLKLQHENCEELFAQMNDSFTFTDVLPENIQNISIELGNMNLKLTSDESKQEFLDYISDVSLYSEYEEGVHGTGSYFATLTVMSDSLIKYIYREDGSDIIETKSNTKKIYGYYPKGEEFTGSKIYLTKYFNKFYDLYKINISNDNPIYTDYLQIFYLETPNYVIESELGDTLFTYTYDNLINSFKFNPKDHGLKIYENDTYYEELPNNKGEHLIVLKKDNISYQLSYIVE